MVCIGSGKHGAIRIDLARIDCLLIKDSFMQMLRACSAVFLIAFGMVISFGSVARSDEWVACKRDSSTGQFLWLRGKSTEPLEQPVFRSSATNPDLGTCLVGHDQLREAHGLRF